MSANPCLTYEFIVIVLCWKMPSKKLPFDIQHLDKNNFYVLNSLKFFANFKLFTFPLNFDRFGFIRAI